jgi:hypothetical protein
MVQIYITKSVNMTYQWSTADFIKDCTIKLSIGCPSMKFKIVIKIMKNDGKMELHRI